MVGSRLPGTLSAPALALLLAAAGSAAAKEAITGTPDDDVLTATPGRDTIRGLAGDDDIRPGKGADRAFGGPGSDTFRWRNGDGHDHLDGGSGPAVPEGDALLVDPAGRPLRLHLRTLGVGSRAATGGGAQVLDVGRIEGIGVGAFRWFSPPPGSAGDDRLVLSSDAGVLPPGTALEVVTGRGRDRIDARGLRVPVVVRPGPGADAVLLGPGPAVVFYELETGDEPPAEFGHDTIHGFGDDDTIELGEPHPFCRSGYLDTDGDGTLTAADGPVSVAGGSMTINLTAGTYVGAEGRIKVTLVGRTRLAVDRIEVLSDC